MVSRDSLEWLKFARHDIDAAQQLYSQQQNPRQRPIEIIMYHCQQGAEKALKAYVVQHSKALTKKLQTHDMALLQQECAQQNIKFNNVRIIKHCANLDPFSVVIRYPYHNLPLTSSNASQGLNSAKRIYDFVCECLGLKKFYLPSLQYR